MKKPTRKFISFSTALVSMVGLMTPVFAAAKYDSELVEECEYDELIEMRDKAILIKDGNDYTVNDDTQLIVIDSNGEKKLISKEEGLSGLYSYVSTTRGQYNFISPTNDPYSFDFFDENYCISTESGSIIAGFGDKFALIDDSGKKISDEYDAIYRISDDYFMVDVIDGEIRKTGLIRADGSVIAAPAEGIGEFYLCGSKFLVSKYTTEIVEEENWNGDIVQNERTNYSYYFMSPDGKAESETFKYFAELGHNGNNSSDNGHNRTDVRYNVNYAFECDCICLTDSDDKQLIYNSKTESFSNKYDYIQNLNGEKFIVSHDGVYDVINTEFKVLIENAEDVEYGYNKVLEVKKDGKVTRYDADLNVLEESAVTKRFPTFDYASVEKNGNIITVKSDDSLYSYSQLDQEFVSVSVNVEIKPVWENSDIEVSVKNDYNSNFDFELEVLEEYYDEALDYNVTTSSRYKYILDSAYEPHDVSEYAKTVRNVNHDIVILQKEDNHLEYVNFADAQDKKDLSPYTDLSPVYDDSQNYNYGSGREPIGYCLMTEDSFVISDMNFNLLNEPVKGTPSGVQINCNDNVYSGDIVFYVNDKNDENGTVIKKYGVASLDKGVIVPAEYDSVSVGYGGYLVTKEGMTAIIGSNGEAIKEFEGAYNFNSITGCVYDADWNLVKRDDGVTSNIVYNIEDGEIKYQQTGIYDEVSYFVDGYATVVKYAANDNNQEDLWSGNQNNYYGIICIDGTEVVKPSDDIYITMNPEFDEDDTSFNVEAYSSTEGKNSSSVALSVKELDTGYINANNMTVAKMISDNRYLALINGLWGVYDGDGKEIIKPQFDYFKPFNENGLSIVETPEYNTCYCKGLYGDYEEETVYKTGVIDIKGNIIVEPYNNITENGIKVCSTRSSLTPYALKTVLLDKYGVQVCKLVNGKPKYMTITSDDVLNDFAKVNGYDIAHKEGNLYYVEKDGLSGVVSEDNEVLVPVEYFEVLSFNPSEINFKYVRPELQGILENEFSSKSNEISDGSKLVYVKTLDGKVGVYKLSESESDDVLGDSNGDGIVNVRDAAFIARKLAERKADELPASADFNEDGKVNVRDAAAIAKFLATGKK
ncbi:dockerin type I domain-containing protein [Porcipelethomonas sp.]|uniref:dockerin type I domain-containing protein n=1 Tax=Porcipelethomonas sp. TaxID=2981675 RepID=UPI003EF9EA23